MDDKTVIILKRSSPLATRIITSLPAKSPISGLRYAAGLRMREARSLYENGYYQGSSYIAGYAVEMELGYCYARVIKAPLHADAASLIGPARRKAEHALELGPGFVVNYFEQGHSGVFWLRMFQLERNRAGKPIPYAKLLDLMKIADFMHYSWKVWLRYHGNVATREDAETILAMVESLYDITCKLQR